MTTGYNHASFPLKVINTLFEIYEKYESLSITQLPNFNPRDLQYIMERNYIDIRFINFEPQKDPFCLSQRMTLFQRN